MNICIQTSRMEEYVQKIHKNISKWEVRELDWKLEIKQKNNIFKI